MCDLQIIRDREKLFLKKVPNHLNNISQFMTYYDKMTLKPSKVEKMVNIAFFLGLQGCVILKL